MKWYQVESPIKHLGEIIKEGLVELEEDVAKLFLASNSISGPTDAPVKAANAGGDDAGGDDAGGDDAGGDDAGGDDAGKSETNQQSQEDSKASNAQTGADGNTAAETTDKKVGTTGTPGAKPKTKATK